MGSTIWNVPANVHTYDKALSIYANSKPIRGMDRRPLGARRNHIKYSVRMAGDGQGVEFVLYKTPVITYHPDDTITIKTDGWSSVATHEMLSWVLGIGAQGWRGNTRLTIGDSVHILRGSADSVKLIKEQGQLRFAVQQERYGYRMNRKAANNVRRRYAPFLDYLKGMLKLRSEEVAVHGLYGYPAKSTMQTRVTLNNEELAQVLGMRSTDGNRLQFDTYLGNVTEGFVNSAHGKLHDQTVRAQQQLMLELINPDQPEQTRHDNHYKAALALTVGYASHTTVFKVQGQILRDPQAVLANVDNALLMAHADEVLEATKLEGKAMPNPKYMNWIDKGESK